MMKKIIAAVISIMLSVSAASAAMIPVSNPDDDTIFSSPALLASAENRTVSFGIELKGYADMDMIGFLSNPAPVLADAAEYLRDFLLEQDDQYLYDNYETIKSIFQFDTQFPPIYEDIAENSHHIRQYLETRFDIIGDGNRALAVSNAFNSDLGVFPEDTSDLVKGDLDFSMRLYGGQIIDGFAWNAEMGIVYDGASSILSSISYKDYGYGNDLYLMLGGDIGYGAYIGDSFAMGVSFSPDFVFKTTIANTDLLTSRVDGSFVALFANNIFDLGLSLDLNIGFMIDAGDAKILFDLRDIPSIQKFWYFSASDVVSEFKMSVDDNIYFIPPDASIGVVWNHGPWHIKAEVSDIANQLIWMAMLPTYKFDILAIPKFSFGYSIMDDMIISLGYESRKVVLGFAWAGLDVEFATSVDKVGFGVTLGYEF